MHCRIVGMQNLYGFCNGKWNGTGCWGNHGPYSLFAKKFFRDLWESLWHIHGQIMEIRKHADILKVQPKNSHEL